MKKYKIILLILLAPFLAEAQDSSLIVTKITGGLKEAKRRIMVELGKVLTQTAGSTQTARSTNTQLELQKDNNYVVTVTKTPLYESGAKNSFERVRIAPCELIPVNTKVSYSDLALFFPPSNMETQIFPGAVFKFSAVKDGSYSFYNHGSPRNPMDLTTDIFTTTAGKFGNTIQIDQFDFGTLHDHWTNLLRDNIRGNTGAETQYSLVSYETERQIKTDMADIGKVSVGAKLNVTIPVEVPVVVNANNDVSLKSDANRKFSGTSKRNSVILKFEQTFYTAHITPKVSSAGDLFTFYKSGKAPSDVVYVSSVDYGMVFYLVISSNATKEVLLNAVNEELKVKEGLGVEIPALPAGAQLNVNTSNETRRSYERALSSSESSMAIYQWGGRPVIVTSIHAAIDSINARNKFSAQNLGKPIRYTLNFADDYSNGYVNVNNSYASADCGKSMSSDKYDVEITSTRLRKVKDYTGATKLAGEIFLKEYTFKRNGSQMKITKNYNFWNRRYNHNISLLTAGDYIRINKTITIPNLTYDELMSLTIYLGAKIQDWRRYNSSVDLIQGFAECTTCDSDSFTSECRISDKRSEINTNLQSPGNETYLTFGRGNIFSLNFKGLSEVSADFQIKVIRK